MRSRFLRTWLRPAAAIAAAGMVLAAPATASAEGSTAAASPTNRQVAFQTKFDPAVAGGEWRLNTTTTGSKARRPLPLASGKIPANGLVTAIVPIATARQSVDLNFTMTAFKPTSDGNGVFGLRQIGPSPDRFVGGAKFDMGAGDVKPVPTYRTEADIPQPSTPDCQAGSSTRKRTSGVPRDNVRSKLPVRATKLRGEPSQGAVSDVDAGTPAGPVPNDPCAGRTTTSTAAAVPECTVRPEGTFCVTDYRNLYCQLAFRGHSERSAGSLSTFSVESGATQRWQTGWRGAAGPFEVSGTKTTTLGVGAKDVWPKRGDCWANGTEYDIEPCWGDGGWKDAGRDTWRWQRHQDRYFQSGVMVEYETLFVTSYDGGTEYLSFPGTGGYYVSPSSVKSGSVGSWSKHSPNSSRETYLEKAVEHSTSATIAVDNWSTYGAASFSSTMTHEQLTKVTNLYEFRGDLPFFNDPNDGQGAWYRYSWESGWGAEYFTCEWAPTWTGGGSCWENGS